MRPEIQIAAKQLAMFTELNSDRLNTVGKKK